MQSFPPKLRGIFAQIKSPSTFVKWAAAALAMMIGAAAYANEVDSGESHQLLWSGNLTPTGITIKAKAPLDSQVLLLYHTSEVPENEANLAKGTFADIGDSQIVSFVLSGLTPNTDYRYWLVIEGASSGISGRFRTPSLGPQSFKIAFSACAGNIEGKSGGGGSNHIVFEKIREERPLFYLQMGDIHYFDISANDPELYRSALDTLFTSERQSLLYREVPLVYVWDDHDYGPNNSGGDSPSRSAAQQVYREYIPHYDLAESASEGAIYHSFAIGRVLFIVTDLRSYKSPNSVPDDAIKTMLGTKQKEWFQSKLIEGRNNYKLVVWVNTVPWIHNKPGDDQWGGYQTERAELSRFILENQINNLCALSGDSHMVAIDDGSNNTFADGATPLFPIFQAAALHRPGSVKGGPYSHGAFPGPGQYGIMEVTDDGSARVQVKWTGMNAEKGVLTEYSFSR